MPSHSDPREPEPNPSCVHNICRHVLNRIGGRRHVPADLLKELARDLNLPRERVQAALRELVAVGELAYTFEHGRTFLEPSFDRPVRVSGRIILTPPGQIFQARRARPSSRYARCLVRRRPPSHHPAGAEGHRFRSRTRQRIADRAGQPRARPRTGSGVLVMAAVKLGIETGWGVDIDPCAVAEAQANVDLNGLRGRIVVSDRAAETIEGSYTLVTGNLRTPPGAAGTLHRRIYRPAGRPGDVGNPHRRVR